ncbi:BON domain-containing protein [Pseudonocardia sp. GCM10023141]|uniref:BON domain-containing protein n=1 Tax=Pseudonocardia sp. GCM10023141 TaxID=3252653 RepID=UPI003615936F
MTQTHHKTDAELKSAVVDELEWVPDVDATRIGVSVNDGAVTLAGEVSSYPEKRNAERAALRVQGVTAVADEITVHSAWSAVTDTDVAREAGEALDRSVEVPPGAVQAVVRAGTVTLSGTVTWRFQRVAAERAVRGLRGVLAVHNDIALAERPVATDIKKAINSALVRNAQIDSNHVDVTILPSGVVTLRGTVQSAAERRQAEHAAWAGAGVTTVQNLLRIES